MKIKGQLKITRMSTEDTIRMNLFLGMRHCKYDCALLAERIGITAKNNTLFGSYGEFGEYLIPSISYHMEAAWLLPSNISDFFTDESTLFAARIDDVISNEMNPTLQGWYSEAVGPQLYYDFRIVSPDNDKFSYLVWSGGEKSRLSAIIITYLNGILAHLNNAQILEGKMAKYDYDTVTTVWIKNGEINSRTEYRSEELPSDWAEFIPYHVPMSSFVAYVAGEAVRNAEVFTNPYDELGTEDACEDDSLWELDEGAKIFLGIFKAYDAHEVRRMAAEKSGVDESLIVAEEVL